MGKYNKEQEIIQGWGKKKRALEKIKTTDETEMPGMDQWLELFPDSPSFLGKEIYFPQSKRNGFRRKKIPDLNLLREKVHKFSEEGGIDNARYEINNLLKRYPYLPDAHAFKAIQTFNDALQSGTGPKKLNIVGRSLVGISKTLHNGGISIFNTAWFMTIYLKYLELLNERISREYGRLINHENRQARRLAVDLYQMLLQIPRLTQVKRNLGFLSMLNVKLKGSRIIAENISMKELSTACEQLGRRNENKTVGPGKTAGNIVFIMLVLNSVYSRIPILRKLVNDILVSIPDISRDLILQKHMIVNTGKVTDFQLAAAAGNTKLAKDLANSLYAEGMETIKEHLENAILTKTYEVDPFLKVAWIAKESGDLFNVNTNKKRLEQSLGLLSLMMQKQNRQKDTLEVATHLQGQIRFAISEYGE
ncbi:MAG: hypothetical protein GY866_17010 [Proteobacteria bacterium]|nr:hypothetical protein [Pseudomonadota bacterium]